MEKFSRSEPTVFTDSGEFVVQFGSESYVLTRAEALRLRHELGNALTRTEEFLHTVGQHRADGSYVVARRGATSEGHRKVFDSLAELEHVYATLPPEFTADDVTVSGVSGGRRHMLVRHFAEHPAFDCELVSRQPLTVRKRPAKGEEVAAD